MIWAKNYSKWDDNKWSKVAFSDESTFALRPSQKSARVWRKRGDRYKPFYRMPTFKSCFKSISVWGLF